MNAQRAAADLGLGVDFGTVSLATIARGSRRLESETYLTSGYGFRVRIESNKASFRYLSQIATVRLPDRLKGVSVGRKHGIPFLTATQVFDTKPTPRKWLAVKHTPDLKSRFVHDGTILCTRSGSVGDAIVAYSAHEEMLISDDLLRIDPSDSVDRGFLYGFIRSRFGHAMLQSSKYGSIIKHLQPEHAEGLPVPNAPQKLKQALTDQIQKVNDLRAGAFALEREAEELFNKSLNVEIAPEPPETGFSIPGEELLGRGRRLDAGHYNPTAEAAYHALLASGCKIRRLEEVTSRVFGVPRFKHVYTTKGMPYLDSEDIFKINPRITKFIPPATKKNVSKYLVESGWLLMACSGQLYGVNGSVALASSWHERKILSNHLVRIVPKDIRSGYLAVAMAHPIFGRPLILRLAFGTEVPEISPADVMNFPVVRLKGQTENEIADRAERAVELRLEADGIEDDAVAQVEAYVAQTAFHGTS